MGTMIQDSGFTDYLLPEELNSKKPDLIRGIHEAYLASGANVLTANSFGSNGIKLKDASFSAAEATTAAIENLRSLIDARDRSRFKQEVFAALDIGPTGQLLAPMGRLSFDEAYEAFKESALAAEKAGADLVIIETFSDLYEAKALSLQ